MCKLCKHTQFAQCVVQNLYKKTADFAQNSCARFVQDFVQILCKIEIFRICCAKFCEYFTQNYVLYLIFSTFFRKIDYFCIFGALRKGHVSLPHFFSTTFLEKWYFEGSKKTVVFLGVQKPLFLKIFGILCKFCAKFRFQNFCAILCNFCAKLKIPCVCKF